MLCIKPFRRGHQEFGCGKCPHCRINERRIKTARILLEAGQHSQSCFLTLTYAVAPWELVPRHWQLFAKALRKRRGPFRFFAVGEYGEVDARPHLHAALFGVGMQEGEAVQDAWQATGLKEREFFGPGWWHLGELNKDSAQYVAGYVTKKLTAHHDRRLWGKHPEFSRSSNRPGVGAGAMKELGAALTSTAAAAKVLHVTGDVPTSLRTRGKILPLGRYLRSKLREEVGWLPSRPELVALASELESRVMTDEERADREVRREVAYMNTKAKLQREQERKVL